ncbi:MAG: hypothetical protein P1P88_15590 [Bacteroidales bacterium]|nr:hypothetical protein [Bacteroidales bacterium]
MIPKRTKHFQVSSNLITVKQQLIEKFQFGKVIRLKETDFTGNRFRLIRSMNFWNPFVTKIILGEIKGKIEEGKIFCDIGMSLQMKIIFYFDSIALLLISLGLLISSEYEAFIATSIFLVLSITFFYFRLKYEIGILTSYMDDFILNEKLKKTSL